MYEVDLQKTPNQSFNTSINNHGFGFVIRQFRGLAYVSIDVDGNNVVNGIRAAHNADLLPASIARAVGGNFRFICQDKNYPNAELYDGVKCRLLFFENGEG